MLYGVYSGHGVHGNNRFGWLMSSYSTFAVPLLAMCADSMYLNGMAGLDQPPASMRRFTGVLLFASNVAQK